MPIRNLRSRAAARLLAVALVAVGAAAVPDLSAAATPPTPAGKTPAAAESAVPAPPMGWASWNTFAARIDYNLIKGQADALVSSGLAKAGYRNVDIDEGWWQGGRDDNGNFIVDPTEWPGGMKAIADYVHSKGLKAGIYTDAGSDGCGYYFPEGRPKAPGSGSRLYYDEDFLQFAKWGFDYVKVDWCGGQAEGMDAHRSFQEIRAAIDKAYAKTGRRLTLSICNWGEQNPWNWGAGIGALWRTGSDIILHGQTANRSMIYTSFDKTLHPEAQHTGYVNDPDMLMVGMPGLSAADNRLHMSLWAIAGAPLIAGNDLTKMTPETLQIMTNPEVIGIDQDTKGLQGVKVAEDVPGLQVYGKVLAGSGKRAVALVNRTGTAAPMTVRWADLGLSDDAAVRDVWARTDLGKQAGSYSVQVPANEAVLLSVSGAEATTVSYEAEAATTVRDGVKVQHCALCSGRADVRPSGADRPSSLTFTGVTAAATGLAVVNIAYTGAANTATLRVNRGSPTQVALPRSGRPATVSALVWLVKGANRLTLANPDGNAPAVDRITVAALPGTAGVQLIGGQAAKCADVPDNTIVNGTQPQLFTCVGGGNQTWTYNNATKQVIVYGNKCLDAYGNGKVDNTKVTIWDCHGADNQKWNLNPNGTITGVASGLCLDAFNNGITNGTKLVLWTCNGQANQQWTRN